MSRLCSNPVGRGAAIPPGCKHQRPGGEKCSGACKSLVKAMMVCPSTHTSLRHSHVPLGAGTVPFPFSEDRFPAVLCRWLTQPLFEQVSRAQHPLLLLPR